jgi:GTP-binding protein
MSSPCEGCAFNAQLGQLGLKMEKYDRIIGLAGNPNTGKSTLFNALTGLHQHTGNWPGKTVTRAEGGYEFSHVRYKVVDLPGTYSLLSASQDEEIARNFILFGRPDCTVVVTDATALERNLNLVLQVLEITEKAVVAVNLMDEARRKGLDVDARSLSRDLGVPAVPIVARTGEGIQTLLGTIDGVSSGEIATKPLRVEGSADHARLVDELAEMVSGLYPDLPNPRWIAIRLLDGDPSIEKALSDGTLGQVTSRQQESDVRLSGKTALAGNQ